MTERARVTRDTDHLVEAVRHCARPAISAGLPPTACCRSSRSTRWSSSTSPSTIGITEDGPVLDVDPSLLERIIADVSSRVQAAENDGHHPVIVCSGRVRSPLRRLLQGVLRDLPVLAYPELARNLQLETIGVIDLAHTTAV